MTVIEYGCYQVCHLPSMTVIEYDNYRVCQLPSMTNPCKMTPMSQPKPRDTNKQDEGRSLKTFVNNINAASFQTFRKIISQLF